MNYHQARWIRGQCLEPLIFELGEKGARGSLLPDGITADLGIPEKLLRKSVKLPELSEPEIVRHYTRLSQMNFCVDTGFYPLGSCTMKYNPKINEELADLDEVVNIHPEQSLENVQGALEIMYRLERFLCEITGMHRMCLHPSAGAHGEFLGLLLVRAYFNSKGEKRKEVIVPDSAHGTNFASAGMAGFDVVVVPSNNRGRVDLEALRVAVSDKTAALMMTNPNTLGLFEDEILEISQIIHDVGGLLYYDGANLNGIIGKARPGDMGFDIVHLNLHKTFSTPHGGGGPGAGPVGVVEKLEKFLPIPAIEYDEAQGRFWLNYDLPYSIGKIKSFYGNFGVLVKAYVYILSMGADGFEEVAETAVLNANYLMKKLNDGKSFKVNYDGPCKHEVVLSAEPLKRETGITAKDVAKRLLDFGVHPPTYYFPPIVPEALMVEPTETESKEELDGFIEAMKTIALESREDPGKVRSAPVTTTVGRLDETRASREPILTWKMYQKLKKEQP
ncbi:MAG: aminomethyl-transferring glycine dehydrogenase subunit GcvPB [Candidatus Hadarchaeaceae archaeon]